MSLASRIEALEQCAAARRVADTTEPSWADALFDVPRDDPSRAYHGWGAVLAAIADGRCFVLYPHTPEARRLAVDYIRPGASRVVCDALQAWCDTINGIWDIHGAPLEEKPATLEEYAARLSEQRPYMAFGSTLQGDDLDHAAESTDTPEFQAIEARFQAWCIHMGIEL